MKTIEINGRLINLDEIKTAEVETSHYMNGSRSILVLTMRDGARIGQEHGWGFDAFAALDEIKKETAI